MLWGGKDRHFPAVHGERLHAAIRILDRAGHWMAWHRADEVSDAILAFSP